jgi:hypothetical protein
MRTIITTLLLIFSITLFGQPKDLKVIGKIVGSASIGTQVDYITWDEQLGTANILWKGGYYESVSYFPSSITVNNDVNGLTTIVFETYTNGYALFGFVIDNNTEQVCAFYIRENGDKQIYLLE